MHAARPGGADPPPPAALNRKTAARWRELRAALPRVLREIGPTVPGQLAHLPATAPAELVVAHLHRDGAVIIDELVSGAACDAVIKDMAPYIAAQRVGAESFGGRRTKRVGALAARSKSSWEILAHPLLMETCSAVLGHQLLHGGPEGAPGKEGAPGFAPGYKQHPWQLHLTQIIQIGQGEPAQVLHRDRWAFVADGLFAHMEPEISTIWALTEFTQESGPTRVVPGSHRWPASRERPSQDLAAHAVMKRGSVVVYTGSAWHSGGNNMSTEPRVGLNVDYNLAWLRQEENQYLSCPPYVAKELPRHLQELLGYVQGGFALGYDGDGRDPKSHAKNTQPVDWATRAATVPLRSKYVPGGKL